MTPRHERPPHPGVRYEETPPDGFPPALPRRGPGALLLRLSDRLFDAPSQALIAQAIADLQHEIREADATGRERFAARWRGYCACWRLIMTLSVAPSPRPAGDRILTVLFGSSRHRPMVLIVAATTLAVWPMLAWFGVSAVVAGILTAVALRLWNDHHPTLVAAREAHYRKYEINLATVHVDGDVGGLIFVVGTVVIVLFGLPGLGPVLGACLVGGVGLGATIFAWRHTHPVSLVCRNSLRLR